MVALSRALVFITQLLLWSFAASTVGIVGALFYVSYLFKYADYDPGAPMLNWIVYGTVFGSVMFLIGFTSRLVFLAPSLRRYVKFGSVAWSVVAIPCLIYLTVFVRNVFSHPY